MTTESEKRMASGLGLLPESVQKNPQVRELPVLEVLEKLAAALGSEKKALVQAAPGAGKTTIIPLALLHQARDAWLGIKKILVLEPRRLAARACALRMAQLLNEPLGKTVGYQVRMERCTGPETRIEVITEGILTRRIQNDPELTGVGLVIFDEFHERNLHSDLGLALALEAAEVFSPDLRLLVMSATMDMEGLSRLMAHAPVLESSGRTWPVTTHYMAPESVKVNSASPRTGTRDKGHGILPACMAALEKALARDPGDILVFLPGAAQIRRMEALLEERLAHRPEISVHPLFGNLSPQAQAAAIAPAPGGRRKIVLSTPIAETSLTIQGVRVVVDSGLAKRPQFSPRTGMSRLETLAISQASAEQRRGRAGRTAPGVCYRLWSEHLHQGLVPFNRPEISGADLSSLVLELALWGVNDPSDLKWLDLPPKSSVAWARQLLVQLGALDHSGRITDHGRQLSNAGIHPRLAQMVVHGKILGQGFTACCLAAVVEAKDFLGAGTSDPDMRLRLERLKQLAANSSNTAPKTPAGQVLAQAVQLARRFDIKSGPGRIDPEWAGRLLALAWPGRVAAKRKPDSLSYLSAQGSGCFFDTRNAVSASPYIVAVDLDGNPKNARIFLAAPYEKALLEADFKDQLTIEQKVVWDDQTRSVRARTKTGFGKLVLDEKPLPDPDSGQMLDALLDGIAREGIKILPWTKALKGLCDRVVFLRRQSDMDPQLGALPDLSEPGLTAHMNSWLAPFLAGISSASGLKQVDLSSALKAMLTWDQQQRVETHAPTHIKVPSGSNLPLKYADEKGVLDAPVLAVRLQEMFGQTQTPCVARGRVAVTLHLLSPASRPVQITQDLENFWKNTYAQVKKDLAGRYPKHYWPEDPLQAQATNRAKPRRK